MQKQSVSAQRYHVLFFGHKPNVATYTAEELKQSACLAPGAADKVLISSPSPLLEESGYDMAAVCTNPDCTLRA